ncbi:MAG: phage tail protein, partial [Oscillibacter sp.]
MIGTLGKQIIFEVSDKKAMTFQGLSRGIKPKPEFLGPGNQKITLPITLSAAMGVRPRTMLDNIADMVERGTAEYLIIGNKPVGKNPFRLTGSSETWDKV